MRTSLLVAVVVSACAGDSPSEETDSTAPVTDTTNAPGAPDEPYDAARFVAELGTSAVDVASNADDDLVRGVGRALRGYRSFPRAARPLSGTVNAGGSCSLPGRITTVRVGSEPVTVYELADPAAAQAAVARVGCAGDMIDHCILEWMAEPHYFVRGRIVVEHVGTSAVARTLSITLGQPVAGEGSACMGQLHAEIARAADQVARGEVGTIHGIVRDARGRAQDLLVVRVRSAGWTGIERTGWAPYGARRRRGEVIATGVPAGPHTVEISRFDEPGILWTGKVDVKAGGTVELDVRMPTSTAP